MATITPSAPSSKRPRSTFPRSPAKWIERMISASRHPHRRPLNHPSAAAASMRLRTRNRSPARFPTALSCRCATGFRTQSLSRNVPGKSNRVAASSAILAPKQRKIPKAILERVAAGITTLQPNSPEKNPGLVQKPGLPMGLAKLDFLFLFRRLLRRGCRACRQCRDVHFPSAAGASFGLDALAIDAF